MDKEEKEGIFSKTGGLLVKEDDMFGEAEIFPQGEGMPSKKLKIKMPKNPLKKIVGIILWIIIVILMVVILITVIKMVLRWVSKKKPAKSMTELFRGGGA